MRSYEDKNGVKRKSYSVVVSDFDFCGSSKNDSKTADNDLGDSWEQADEDCPF